MATHINPHAISSELQLRDLDRLYDHTESHVRSLKSLGIEATSYGTLLSPVLALRLTVSRKIFDSNLNMDALFATFEEQLAARERPNPQSTRRSQESLHHTASILFSGSQDSNADSKCSYCQQSYSSTSCSFATDAAAPL